MLTKLTFRYSDSLVVHTSLNYHHIMKQRDYIGISSLALIHLFALYLYLYKLAHIIYIKVQ